MQFRLWTDDCALAAAAAAAGVRDIGPDFESAGKAARQAGTDSLLSRHSPSCLHAIRSAIGDARLFARCNPPAVARGREIDMLLDAGVTSIMLPMVRTLADAADIARQLRGRATLTLMIEHADALPVCDALARIDGVSALYLGANDLALSLGLASRFAALAPSLVEPVAETARARGIEFGFFGLARADDTDLPVPTNIVLAEWARLGVTYCVIARSFRASIESITDELRRVRDRFAWWQRAAAPAVARAHAEFVRCCEAANAQAATHRGLPGFE